MTASRASVRPSAEPTRPLADTLPHANEFIRDVLDAASATPYGTLAWPEINRLAARRLRPTVRKGQTNSSQLGHAVVIEMVARGLIDAELTTAKDGTPMVARVLHPRISGLHVCRSMAAQQPVEEVLCRRGELISVEIEARDRRRIGDSSRFSQR